MIGIRRSLSPADRQRTGVGGQSHANDRENGLYCCDSPKKPSNFAVLQRYSVQSVPFSQTERQKSSRTFYLRVMKICAVMVSIDTAKKPAQAVRLHLNVVELASFGIRLTHI